MKKRFYLLAFILFACIPSVNAATYWSGSCYYFSGTTGAYSATETSSINHKDCMKKLDNNDAYCVQWKKHIVQTSYSEDATWDSHSKSAIVAGIMIDLIDAKYDGVERYAMTAASLNTLFGHYLLNSYSYDFYNSNSTIKSFYDQAMSKYATYKITTKLPSLKLTTSNTTFNYSNGVYLSDKITLSGLKETYGGDGVTYTISASNNAKICTKASGVDSSCKDSIPLSNRSTDYSFYVKATGVSAADDVTIKVTGKNSSTYPTTVRYTSGSDSQLLLVKSSYSINRSVSKSLVLNVPDLTKHRIVAYKLDESGALLSGANLEIYKDDYTVANNLLAKNDGNASKITYTSPTVAVDDDDFFQHDYYLVEKSAPDGYVLNSKVNNFYIKGSSSSATSSICYFNGGSDSDESTVVDSERCNFSAYQYKCKASNDGTYVDLPESGNCDELNVSEPEDTTDGNETTGTDDTPTGDDTTSGSDTTGGDDTEPTIPEPPSVQYTQVCYNTTSNKEVTDVTFCSEKNNYIKVEKSGGNLTVSQVNNKNTVKISKRAATGDDEVPGAKLKICSAVSYKEKQNDCDPAKTIEDIEMSWVSGSNPYEFSGLKSGEYYVIETLAPTGYIKATTATSFTIDSFGEVKTGGKVANDNLIIIKNTMSSFWVSKQDMATSLEVPGATISICVTYIDDNKQIQMGKNQYTGECVPAILADGSTATWVSTNEPKKITGLSAGTYYLVERIAPTDYSTAESILFKITEDGKLVDKDGNSLADNKLVMKDEKIDPPETGIFSLFLVLSLVIIAGGSIVGAYYFLGTGSNKTISDTLKIRKRKIHK